MTLRITTWNVNGVKNPLKYHPWSSPENRSYQRMFDILEADIVCFQELKIQKKDLTDDIVIVPGWDSYFTFPKHKQGYSGVAVYTRNLKCQPIKAEEGITGILEPPRRPGETYLSLPPDEQIGGYPSLTKEDAVLLDSEGRALVIDFGAFVLIGTYCPASTDPGRDDFRAAFVDAVFERARKLIEDYGRRVVIVGDLNIARNEIDCHAAQEVMAKMNIDKWTDTTTRTTLKNLLEPSPDGVMVDIVREFFPDRVGMYTHWDVFKNKRPGNAGMRIDYVLCSSDMKSWFTKANIQEGLMGSDHCPVFGVIGDTVDICGQQKHILDLVFPKGTYKDGNRDPSVPMPPPPRLCMKLLSSEFGKRQSIKDMFTKISSARLKSTLQITNPLDPLSNKRSASDTPDVPTQSASSSSKKLKKQSPQSTKGKQNSSQQSLKGFFKPPATTATTTPDAPTPLTEHPSTPRKTAANSRAAESVSPSFVDPIESKEQWGKLFVKRRPPACSGHGEECIQLTTKKSGPNCGRAFWMCRRPIGPEGEKMVKSGQKSDWKCDYFKWASEWKGYNSTADIG